MGVVIIPQVDPNQMVTSKSKQRTDVKLLFSYTMQNYQEIRNEKDYGLDDLWSNIGGFLGIFIGYSLFNLLNDGYDYATNLLNVNSSPRRPVTIGRREVL